MWLWAWCWFPLVTASAADGNGLEFFESRIRPVLVEHCYSCHSPEAKEVKADFLLDTRAGIRKGGKSGRDAIIPGNANASQLLEAIRYGNEDLQMPPETQLPASVVADFETWIAMGAPDPRDGLSRLPREIAAENHWAWKPPNRHPLPEVTDAEWPRDPLDYFVLEKLEREGLRPNPDAERATWLRRVTLELTGLPPTLEEQRAFLEDARPDPDAFAAVVDRLLYSEAFGVRWGRHWLDVARYAESSGFSRNMLYPYAWRYRNYVIDSLNADKPVDQFIREQLAGDLLPADTPEQRDDQILGTGFLTIGAKSFNEANELLFHLNTADELIDATCRAFLALTVNCARCHDHKYDPIPTADYYAMAGIFLSSRHLAGSETNVRNEHGAAYPLGEGSWSQLDAIAEARALADAEQATYMALVKERNTLREPLEEEGIDWKKNPTPELAAAEAKVQAQQDVVRAAKAAIPDPPAYAMAVVEGMNSIEAQEFAQFLEAEKEEIAEAKKRGEKPADPTPARPQIQDAPLYEKGSHEAPLEPVPRGALSHLSNPLEPIEQNESGRLQLANWIVDPANPLTARVYVNRVWYHLFGRGLVETVDNFGLLGSSPSHPELLDQLALDFMENEWSTKALIRRIVLSRTWSQSSDYHAQHSMADPDNIYFWRFAPQLLEGEAIRDSILHISGRLDPAQVQGSQVEEISKQQTLARQREIGRRDYYTKDVKFDVAYRSIYLPMARGELPNALAAFDAPNPNLVVGDRKLTIVPTQALYLLNSEMVTQEARQAAQRVLSHPPETRLKIAYQLVLGREPAAEDASAVQQFLTTGESLEESWTQICHALFCSGEFRTLY